MAQRTTLFLCRHASPHNPEGVFYGHLDGFGLSPVGIEEAHGLGELLGAREVGGIWTSPLLRARETAAVIAGHLRREVPVAVDEDLVETRFGRYIQGVRRREVILRRPLFFVHYLRPGLLPQDEEVGALAARVGRACLAAVAACRGGTAALVSHADPIKALWNRHLGRADWRFHHLRVDRGSALELDYLGDRLEAVAYHPPRRAGAGSGKKL
jgi:broad specificity phosphatase PhoE